jgi:hypothetical protein
MALQGDALVPPTQSLFPHYDRQDSEGGHTATLQLELNLGLSASSSHSVVPLHHQEPAFSEENDHIK